MTTQQEVIEAFANFETEPRRASNFKMVLAGNGGLEAYLVGGGKVVYAERRPIGQITLYPDWTYSRYVTGSSIGRRGIRMQARKVVGELDPEAWSPLSLPDMAIEREERQDYNEERIRPTVDEIGAI